MGGRTGGADARFLMLGPALHVHRAPGPLFAGQAFVLALATPLSSLRDTARQSARCALRALLAPALGCAPAEVPLQCEPGNAPRLALETPHIGLAIAHEAGLSLVAALRGGRIGIDLMRIEPVPDWEAVARDYLGAEVCERLAQTAAAARPAAFAAAWTRFEAMLKCHGRPLVEYSASPPQLFPNTRSLPLVLPQGYAGYAAWIAE